VIKLALLVTVGSALLLSQVSPEPSSDPDGPGPFANSGQVVIVVVTILINAFSGWYTNKTADQREARKEKLLLEQRKLDDEKQDRQRRYDLEDRKDARDELERRLQERAAELARKVDERAEIRDEKLDNITTLVDGAKSVLLQQIADLKREKADKSGLPEDRAAAESAQRAADEQHARVQAAAARARPGD
jgi:hypothetical protein